MGSVLPAVGAATGLLGLIQGGQAASAQKKAANAASGVARNQRQLFQQTTPYYNAVLQYLAQNAGLPGFTGQPGAAPGQPARPTVNPTATRNQRAFSPVTTPATGLPGGATPPSTPLPPGSGALPDSLLGIFAQDPSSRLQFQAAEEDISRLRDTREDQLRFLLGRQGAGSATTAAALARNEGEYQEGVANFRRQLAMQARAEQERRAGLLLSALQPGLGAGPSAAGIFGNQASLYGGQATAAGQGIGSMIASLMLAEAMRRQPATGGFGGGAGPIYGPIDTTNPLAALQALIMQRNI